MRPYLTFPVEVLCPHGGRVVVTRPTARAWCVGDEPVVLKSDIDQRSIAGCPLPVPCTTAEVVDGVADELWVEGEPVLFADCRVRTNSGAPCSLVHSSRWLGAESLASPVSSALPPADSPRPETAKQRVRLRLRFTRPAWVGGTGNAEDEVGTVRRVRIRAVQGKRSTERRVHVPTDGSQIDCFLPADAGAPVWIVIDDEPGWLSLESLERVDEPAPLRGGRERQGRQVAEVRDFRRRLSGVRPTEAELRELHGLGELAAAGTRYPDGWLARFPWRLEPGQEVDVTLRPRFPRLWGLRHTSRRLEQVVEACERELQRGHWLERADLARLCELLSASVPAAEKALAKAKDGRYEYQVFQDRLAELASRCALPVARELHAVRLSIGTTVEALEELRKELSEYFDLSLGFDALAPNASRDGHRSLAAAGRSNAAAVLLRDTIAVLARGLWIVSQLELRDASGIKSWEWDWPGWEQWYQEIHDELLGKEGRLRGRDTGSGARAAPAADVTPPRTNPRGAISVMQTATSELIEQPIDRVSAVFSFRQSSLTVHGTPRFLASASPAAAGMSRSAGVWRFEVERQGIVTVGDLSWDRWSTPTRTGATLEAHVARVDRDLARKAARVGVLKSALSLALLVAWFDPELNPEKPERRRWSSLIIDSAGTAKLVAGLGEALLEVGAASAKLRLAAVHRLPAADPSPARGMAVQMGRTAKWQRTLGLTSGLAKKIAPGLDFVMAAGKASDGDYLGAAGDSVSGIVGVLVLLGMVTPLTGLAVAMGIFLLDLALDLSRETSELERDLEELVRLLDRLEFGAHPEPSTTLADFSAELNRVVQRLPWRCHRGVLRTTAAPGTWDAFSAVAVRCDPQWLLFPRTTAGLRRAGRRLDLHVVATQRNRSDATLSLAITPDGFHEAPGPPLERTWSTALADSPGELFSWRVDDHQEQTAVYPFDPRRGTGTLLPTAAAQVYQDGVGNVVVLVAPQARREVLREIPVPAGAELIVIWTEFQYLGRLPWADVAFPRLPPIELDPLTLIREISERQQRRQVTQGLDHVVAQLGFGGDQDGRNQVRRKAERQAAVITLGYPVAGSIHVQYLDAETLLEGTR